MHRNILHGFVYGVHQSQSKLFDYKIPLGQNSRGFFIPCHSELISESNEILKQVQNDKKEGRNDEKV